MSSNTKKGKKVWRFEPRTQEYICSDGRTIDGLFIAYHSNLLDGIKELDAKTKMTYFMLCGDSLNKMGLPNDFIYYYIQL